MDWHYLHSNELENIPYKQLHWLTKPYILSQALKQVSLTFKVQLLSQGNAILLEDDQIEFNLSLPQEGFLRQVFLCGNDVPWVYARVAIPQDTLANYHYIFSDLDNRPIGETFLYNNPKVSRSLFQIKYFVPSDPIYQIATKGLDTKHYPEKIWARRSIFYLGESPFTITEAFLENIPLYKPVNRVVSS
jgi:chorismate lyase